jgi:uncharacterized repeat protein (TIGR04138 family)
MAMDETLRKLAGKGDYSPEAFLFMFEALEHALVISGKEKAKGSERHISGQQLLEGMREYARRLFGPLAAQTWRSWGIHTSLDWGRIVFMLVEAGLLNRQDSDSLDDFDETFDYEEYFVKNYRPDITGHLGEAS